MDTNELGKKVKALFSKGAEASKEAFEKAGYDTTVGIHKIIFKDTNRTLHGSYGEAFVRYWMRFTNGGQGLHDAGWRNKFGQTIYVTNGSHGCVNLTRPTAKTIYENSYVGMFVIVEN